MKTDKLHNALSAFPLTAVEPKGWLLRQLEIQMKGLTGILHEAWDSVGSYSGWLGGTGENWERCPYYLDGLLPLSYYLDDGKHRELCDRFIAWALKSQDKEGNFGPAASKDDYWSRFVMLKVLIQYAEITGDPQVNVLCKGYFKYAAKSLDQRPLAQWGKARAGDLLYCIKWLYEQEPDAALIDLAQKVSSQALDWGGLYTNFPFTRATSFYYNWDKVKANNTWSQFDVAMAFHATHIVNVAMGLKFPAMQYCFDHNKDHYAALKAGLEALAKYHGTAAGIFNGDEHLSGNSPSQGAELCSVVELMFSLQCMLESFGDPAWGDLLERIAYNSLPATISEDFMSHQYLQQANQVLATVAKRNWFNNDDTSNTFGLEPNFGCCTANMHQGWPKFLKSLWFREGEDTLVSMVFAPSAVKLVFEGCPYKLELGTSYPFRDILNYKVVEGRGKEFTLKIRHPQWASNFDVRINGKPEAVTSVDNFLVIKRIWDCGDILNCHFAMPIAKSRWFNNSLAVERGPLVFGLDIAEKWTAFRETGGIKDYEIRPESEWNYALDEGGTIEAKEKEIADLPFSKKSPPVILEAPARKLPSWGLENNSAAPPPLSPVQTAEPVEIIRLIPYGCAKLRISQFPYYSEASLK
ncbi:beta-L-arabinofuranosidase domain-containing protein [Leadbettera azotonutricia]|uniref:DUF1680 family protein n=1 Tax=Leadbettera azotonutricia (strain ATCC BAA-888 / DSM 13862 / ZAS-9) TaxID=545695 RepID=F5YEC8_LEAAZ|nr:beta-L-arabinofuranosidase domain-containing protein [Leadbettera azotonutricia]AEF80501.1 conserved hypothetical protein [Leadbettera azotonutricia ZAS-9]